MTDPRDDLPPPTGPPVSAGAGATHDTPPAADTNPGVFDTAVGVIVSPTETLRDVTRRQPIAWAIVVVLVINGLSATAQAASFSASFSFGDPSMQPGLGFSGVGALLFGIFVGAPFGLAMAALFAAIVMLFARMFKGTGTYRATFCGLAFAYVPQIFGVIVTAATIPFGLVADLIDVAVALGMSVWTLVLGAIAVKHAHGLTTGKAVAVVLLPIAAIIALVLLVVVVIVGALFLAL